MTEQGRKGLRWPGSHLNGRLEPWSRFSTSTQEGIRQARPLTGVPAQLAPALGQALQNLSVELDAEL